MVLHILEFGDLLHQFEICVNNDESETPSLWKASASY